MIEVLHSPSAADQAETGIIDPFPPAVLLRHLILAVICLSLWPSGQAEVVIEGIPAALEANVRAHLALDDETCDQDPARIRYRFQSAEPQIHRGLEPFGFYAAVIESSLQQPEDQCWRASFSIVPGEPVRINALEIQVLGPGSSLPQFQALLADPGIALNDALQHAEYERVKSTLLVLSREYGFFDARLTSNRLEIDPAARTAGIALILESGPRYHFGELHVEGDVLDEDLIKRFVEFETGAPFEQRRLRELQNDLVAGDFFREVDVRTETKADHRADVLLRLTEGSRIRWGVGFGYGTDTGLVVRGDSVMRRLNRRGHRLEIDGEISKPAQSLTADYRIPGRRPQRDWYSLYGGIGHRDTDALETVSWRTGVRMNRFHSLRLNSTPFLELGVERFKQDGDWQTEQTLVPGYSITFVDADAASRPTRGIRLSAEAAVASDSVLSDVSFLRLRTRAKTILPLTSRARMLVRGEFGWMTSGDFEAVPPTWRFYAGGDSSVRGYDYQSLGPADDEGRSLGGERVFTSSVEVDWRVRERWSGAVFADAGNVGNEDLFRAVPWSVGFGARWYSPIGPLRLDLAFPQSGENSFRVHISMGPDL